jgi:hypothetical protein
MNPFFFYTVQIHIVISTRKDVIIIIWLNRDDGDHVLIVMRDVNLEDGRTIRMNFFSDHSKITKRPIYS